MFLRQVRRHCYLTLSLLVLVGVTGWSFSKQLWSAGNSISSKSSQGVTSSFSKPDKTAQARINEAYGRLPLSFEANQGQTSERVNFLSRGNGYSLFLSPAEAVLQLKNSDGGTRKGERRSPDSRSSVVRMEIVGANQDSVATGIDKLPGTSNYLVGSESQKWATNVPTYSKVRYTNIYPGVDIVYYGNQRQLEYDFILEPGAELDNIALKFDSLEYGQGYNLSGLTPIEIDEQGDLLVSVSGGKIKQHRPIVYQENEGTRQMIAGRYVLKGENRVGFEVASYDSNRPLIIDPVLTYSTFLGGGGADEGADIAVDSTGNAYITGGTMSTNFPIAGSVQGNNAGGSDAFVTKLNSAGNVVVYSTFIGGSAEDFGSGIAIDQTGNVYITGDTTSTNFPTVSPFQAASGGRQDGFVAKLNAAGNALIYSTYLGGAIGDAGIGITVDNAGNAYVTGTTNSTNFPTVTAPQTTNGGSFDAFVTKLNPSGSALVYSTYLGGSSGDFGIGIAVDNAGSAYITGSTNSPNFPLAIAFQTVFGGGVPFGDAFVTKLTPAGNTYVYSTFLGGSGSDFGSGIVVDATGNAFVTGGTLSPYFPTINALQSTFKGGRDFGDVFVTKLNSSGNMPIFSTYLGGNGDDFGSGIAVDSGGNIYITGSTGSNFPIVDPLTTQNVFSGGISDAFVMKLNASGSSIIYSTYLGGGIEDRGTSISLDPAGNAYITGNTNSSNFPTARPFQAGNNGKDTFVAKITDTSSPPLGDFTLNINPATQTITAGASTSFTVGVQPQNNFTQPVNLSAVVSPANSNITVSFSQVSVTPGNNATLTVNTGAATTPGNFAITITGTSGQLVRTQTANITVNAPAPTPDFALVFNPSTLNVSRKQKGQITATVNRVGGFTGNVTVTAPDTKAIKVTLTPPTQSTTGTSVAFNFKVKKKAPRGTQQLTFTARDDSGRVRTATLTFVVQ